MTVKSRVVSRQACPSCKESGGDWDNDNLIIYDNGGKFCHVCKVLHNTGNTMTTNTWTVTETKEPFDGEFKDIISRKISKETCIKNNYKVADWGGKEVHIADFGTGGQKVRFVKDKKFIWHNKNNPGMYGLDDPSLDTTKPLFLVEGEIDKLSVNEVGYQACSVSGSISSLEDDLKRNYDKLMRFQEIVLFLDNSEVDSPEANKYKNIPKEIIPLEKLKVIVDYKKKKDANDILKLGKDKLIEVLESRQEIVPEGLIFADKLDFEVLKVNKIKSIPLPWPELDQMLNGLEYGCLYMFLAGTSVGKSSLLRELCYFYRKEVPDLKIGCFFLEENKDVTPLAFAAIHNNIPLGNLRRDRSLLSDDQWKDVQDNLLNTENLVFLNSDFKRTSSNLLKTIEYLVTVKKFDLIIIDHISYIIGRSGISKHGERRDVDEFIYALQDLVQRLGCIVVAVSHVNESESGKRWDQGEVPNIYSGRSSKVLAQVPDGIIGLARDLTNPNKSDILGLYNLKNRWFSKLGKADSLFYINNTGRMKLLDKLFEGGEDED